MADCPGIDKILKRYIDFIRQDDVDADIEVTTPALGLGPALGLQS